MAYSVTLADKTFYGSANQSNHWWLGSGLVGWYDGVANRIEAVDVPGQHGSFTPQQVLLSGRHMTFECAIEFSTSAEAEASGVDWLASLSAMEGFDFSVTDAGSTKYARCWIEPGQVVLSKRISEKVWKYSIPLFAPDPLKYGELETVRKGASYVVSGGLQYALQYPLTYGDVAAAALSGYVQLFNSGTADVYPMWRVGGPITLGFQILSDDYVVRFDRALLVNEEVYLGPEAGGRALLRDESGAITDVSVSLTQANWASVPKQGQRGFIFSPIGIATGGSFVEATIRDGWF